MPQMNKGGKFIFGKSLIKEDGTLQFPEQAIQEYDIMSEGKIYLITGSKKTGGVCVTRRSGDIAFTMGAFGPLVEESLKHESEIQLY